MFVLEVWIEDISEPMKFRFSNREEAVGLRDYITECASEMKPPDKPFCDEFGSQGSFLLKHLRFMWLSNEDPD